MALTREFKEFLRDRLLGCLDPNLIVTKEAKEIIESLVAKGTSVSTAPDPFFEVSIWNENIGTEPVDKDETETINLLDFKAVLGAVQKYINLYQLSSLTLEQVNDLFPKIQALHQLLSNKEHRLNPMDQEEGIRWLLAGCSLITTCKELTFENDWEKFLINILLDFTDYSEPTYIQENEDAFEDHRIQGFPLPRVETAKGLSLIAGKPSGASPQVLDALETLLSDKVAAVRNQVVKNLWRLNTTASQKMWQFYEFNVKYEENRGVIQSLLENFLIIVKYRLAPDRLNVISEWVKQIYDKVSNSSNYQNQKISTAVRIKCADIWVYLYFWENHQESYKALIDVIRHVEVFDDEVQHIIFSIKKLLTYSGEVPVITTHEQVRTKAWELLNESIVSIKEKLNYLQSGQTLADANTWPPETLSKYRQLLQAADKIGMDLYFSSGAFDDRNQDEQKLNLTLDLKKYFLEKSKNAISELSELGLPNLDHHLLETLEYLIELNPEDVFLQIGKIVQNASKAGYQYESMGTDLVVNIVKRYLAGFRYIFQKKSDCRKVLRETLDIFVLAGWPSAIQLVYELDEIFR